MKTIQLTVKLTFEDKINTDEEIKNVAANVLDTLVHECDSGIGLAPDETETFTRKIEIYEPFTETNIKKEF